MTSPPRNRVFSGPPFAWLTAVLAGVVAPAAAMLMLADAPSSTILSAASGPLLALGLMGIGIIAAAAAGRLWVGLFLALLNAVCLIVLAYALGMPPVSHPISAGLAAIIASFSFAARGALFARSAADKGWLIALFVVAGEASILCTAYFMPDALPGWLLVLLPAQWASVAVQTALTGTGLLAATPVLIALGGTGVTTLLVARLLPRRWPYMLMFTAWLGLSALVWNWPNQPRPHTAPAQLTEPSPSPNAA